MIIKICNYQYEMEEIYAENDKVYLHIRGTHNWNDDVEDIVY